MNQYHVLLDQTISSIHKLWSFRNRFLFWVRSSSCCLLETLGQRSLWFDRKSARRVWWSFQSLTYTTNTDLPKTHILMYTLLMKRNKKPANNTVNCSFTSKHQMSILVCWFFANEHDCVICSVGFFLSGLFFSLC